MASVSQTLTSPPMVSPPPHSDKDSDYTYFVVTMAVVAIMLIVSNIIAYACCSTCGFVHWLRMRFWARDISGTNRNSIRIAYHQAEDLIPACKYRKGEAAHGYGSDSECSVCLSAFGEGEEVRQLPQCKHSFHAPCIDMWLYSHSSCPLCRARVLALPLRCISDAVVREDSEHGQQSSQLRDATVVVISS